MSEFSCTLHVDVWKNMAIDLVKAIKNTKTQCILENACPNIFFNISDCHKVDVNDMHYVSIFNVQYEAVTIKIVYNHNFDSFEKTMSKVVIRLCNTLGSRILIISILDIVKEYHMCTSIYYSLLYMRLPTP